MYFSQKENSFNNDLIILVYYESGKHYNQLYYINKNSNVNNYESKYNSPKDIDSRPHEKLLIAKGEIKMFNSIKEIFNSYKNNNNNIVKNIQDNISKDLDFERKIKEGYNYPKYDNHFKGKSLLLYIRKYLIGKKKNKKSPIYPPYISNNEKKEIH